MKSMNKEPVPKAPMLIHRSKFCPAKLAFGELRIAYMMLLTW